MSLPTRETLVKIARKLRSPSDLRRWARWKLFEGNEYPYFDVVDAVPAVGWLLDHAPARVDFDRPRFLAGLRRSGTTVFFRIMDSHPDLVLFNERFPGDRYRGHGKATARNIWSVDGDERFRSKVRQYLGPRLRSKSRTWGVKLCLELAHEDHGSITCSGMRRILRVYPESRTVGIVRDPRDFVLSATHRGGHDTEYWLDEYRTMLALFRELREAAPESFRIVRYEDLVTRPEEVVPDCCRFFGLSFEEAMLDPRRWSNLGPKVYASNRIVANVEKWVAVADREPELIQQINRACFPLAEQVGYTLEPQFG